MKLYHLADVLTLIEGLLSILIMLLSLTHTTPPKQSSSSLWPPKSVMP